MSKQESRSTDEFNPPRFRPHGRVTFTRHGNVLVAEGVGPFNKELMDAVSAVETGLIAKLIEEEGKWASVIVLKESALATDIVMVALTEYLRSLIHAGISASVRVLVLPPDVEGHNIMKPQFVKAFANAGLTLAVFDQLEEAIAWSKLQLKLQLTTSAT